MCEAIGFEALHAAAFMVNADQQIRAHAFDLAAQCSKLLAVLPVACKQNHATHQRVFEALAVCLGKGQSGNVNDERGVLGHTG